PGAVRTCGLRDRERLRRADHRVRRGGDREEAKRAELVRPHAREEALSRHAVDLQRVVRVPRLLPPEIHPLVGSHHRRVDHERHTVRRQSSPLRPRTAREAGYAGDGPPKSSFVASRVPSASASSFAHWIEGCTRWKKTPCANPQSVPPMTFSRPTRFARRMTRSATSCGCSTTRV